MNSFGALSAGMLEAIRRERPLVHNITNFVVMNATANALLALGASPVMAHALEEVEEMVSLAGALVLNIGTLTPDWVQAMIRAGRRANALGIPVALDPVGAGATALRTDSARRILDEVRITVLRGNASEVLSLAGSGSGTRGVDSLHGADEAVGPAARMARDLGITVAVTGEVDRVTDGRRLLAAANGHALMGRVTGMGCTATALVGAFLASERDPCLAASAALATLGLAGERAANRSEGPGSFAAALIDALAALKGPDLESGVRICSKPLDPDAQVLSLP